MLKDGQPTDLKDLEKPFSERVCLVDGDAASINNVFAIRFSRTRVGTRVKSSIYIAAPREVPIVREDIQINNRTTHGEDARAIRVMAMYLNKGTSFSVGDYQLTYRLSQEEPNQCYIEIKSPSPVTVVPLGDSLDMVAHLQAVRAIKPSISS